MSKRWWFIEYGKAGHARWAWRLLADEGGSERKSREFHSYGEAVRDAIAHGFRPTEGHWAIESAHLVTHYVNGRQGKVLARNGKQYPLPSSSRTLPKKEE